MEQLMELGKNTSVYQFIIKDCGSDHELLIAKFRLKLKKVGKTTRSFRYDLNQIPYDYTVEVTNRFKGLDLIDRVPEELWMKVRDIVQEVVIKTIKLVQFSSVAQLCPTLCNPMNCSTPGLPAHHQLLEFTQTHVHRVGDAILSSHPLMSPSPPAPNPSQHQGLFQWVNSLHEVAKVLKFQLQHQSFQRTSRTDLQDGLVGSPCSPRDSQEFSPTPQFKSINFSALSFLHSPTLTSIHDHWKNHSLD